MYLDLFSFPFRDLNTVVDLLSNETVVLFLDAEVDIDVDVVIGQFRVIGDGFMGTTAAHYIIIVIRIGFEDSSFIGIRN